MISWGISPPENGSVKSVDLLNQSINRKDGINWGVFTKKDLEAIGGVDLVVVEVTDENIAIGYQIAVAVQQKKPVLILSRHDISSVSLSSNVNPDFDQFVTIKRCDLNTVSGILKGFFEKNDIKNRICALISL